MPISVKWFDENQNIMLSTFEGRWDLNDFYEMSSTGAKMLKDVDYPFVTIVDFTRSQTPPRKMLTIGQHVDRVTNPHRLKVIFVKPGFFVEQLYSILSRLYSAGFGDSETVESVDEALALAEKILPEAKNR